MCLCLCVHTPSTLRPPQVLKTCQPLVVHVCRVSPAPRGVCVQGFSSSQPCVQVPGAGTHGAAPKLYARIDLALLPYTPHSPIAPGGAPRPPLHSLQQGSSNAAATDQFWRMEVKDQISLPQNSSLCWTRPRRSQTERVWDAFPHLGPARVTYLLPPKIVIK